MKKILILIKNNTMIFKEKTRSNKEELNLINTNIISTNELLFSIEYIESNKKIMVPFIKEITAEHNIDTAIIENTSILLPVLDIIKSNQRIVNLIVKEDVQLSYKMIEKITKSYINSLNCYNLQPFMLEILDKHNILVESRSEILFLSNFMSENNLNSYSSLFYKMTLRLDFPLTEQDEEDFENFCKINKYLKTIHVNVASRSDLEEIVEILKKHQKKNIKIIIHENISDINTIEYLKTFNKKHSKKHKIYFRLDYSDTYLADNILKQTNTSILKLCVFLIIITITSTFGYVFYDNYTSMKRVENIQEKIQKVIQVTNTKELVSELNEELKNTELKVINEDIASLLTINPDVVGWLKVNNTNIDYPVVQSYSNEFYLNHDIYSEEDYNGWVFMDYRNDIKELSDHLIIYAHNRYYSGVMFGTLQNALRNNWYTNEENQIIKFRSLYADYEFQIFSVYKIYKTNDYIATEFTNNNAKEIFFNKIKERSIYDFDVQVDKNSKVLTLSTCADNDNRIVVHAVLKD